MFFLDKEHRNLNPFIVQFAVFCSRSVLHQCVERQLNGKIMGTLFDVNRTKMKTDRINAVEPVGL